MVIDEQALGELNAEQLREVTQRLLAELRHQRALNEKLTYECALLKRLKFAAQSERHSADQRSLLEEELDSDLAAVHQEIEQLRPAQPATDKQQPKRTPLPAKLPRREIHHEPQSTICSTPGCGCQLKRIGEDVAEKLDYVPGVFTVERHIRGKWACAKCQTITQAPVAAHVIDKGIPTAGLLAQVLVAKYQDHQPLYRQENIFGRAGLAIPRSTLAQWVGTCGARLQPLVDALKAQVLGHRVLHGDETPVAMLKPGSGKTHRAYLWAYAPGAFEATRAVVYDFCESRAGDRFEAVGDLQWHLVGQRMGQVAQERQTREFSSMAVAIIWTPSRLDCMTVGIGDKRCQQGVPVVDSGIEQGNVGIACGLRLQARLQFLLPFGLFVWEQAGEEFRRCLGPAQLCHHVEHQR